MTPLEAAFTARNRGATPTDVSRQATGGAQMQGREDGGFAALFGQTGAGETEAGQGDLAKEAHGNGAPRRAFAASRDAMEAPLADVRSDLAPHFENAAQPETLPAVHVGEVADTVAQVANDLLAGTALNPLRPVAGEDAPAATIVPQCVVIVAEAAPTPSEEPQTGRRPSQEQAQIAVPSGAPTLSRPVEAATAPEAAAAPPAGTVPPKAAHRPEDASARAMPDARRTRIAQSPAVARAAQGQDDAFAQDPRRAMEGSADAMESAQAPTAARTMPATADLVAQEVETGRPASPVQAPGAATDTRPRAPGAAGAPPASALVDMAPPDERADHRATDAPLAGRPAQTPPPAAQSTTGVAAPDPALAEPADPASAVHRDRPDAPERILPERAAQPAARDTAPPVLPSAQTTETAPRMSLADGPAPALAGSSEPAARQDLAPLEARANLDSAAPASRSETPAQTAARAQHVAQQITIAVGAARDGKVEMRLDPPDLGRVRIELHASEDGVRAVVMAEKAETQEFLRRNADLLTRDLTETGFGSVSLDFSANTETQTGSGADEESAWIGVAEDGAPPAPGIARPARHATREAGTGRLDIRL